MRLFYTFFLTVFLFTTLTPYSTLGKGDGMSKFSVNGYVKYLQTITYDDFQGNWFTDNLVHNRINTKWYATDQITGTFEFRNRFFYGDFVKYIPDYKELAVQDNGYLDLSFTWIDGESYMLNTTIDRIYFDYVAGDFQARIGRQRINWGQNLVWNPNDV